MPYPVVAEHLLPPVPRRRFAARRRTPGEIPQPLARQRLVYFTLGRHVLDDMAMPLDSPTVVEATRVSVVDITPNTVVAVPLTIPSQDATTFTLLATFLCTVEDPVAVVRAGGHPAEAMLTAYLKAYHHLFEAGLDYAVTEINDVRRKLSALVRAYTMVAPPAFDGMPATLANVEVRTPDELIRFQESLRDEQQRHAVDMERQRHEQRLLDQRLLYERQRSRTTRDQDAEQREFEREQLRHVSSAVADDPIAALTLSYTAGDISAKELAAELRELRHQEVTQDHDDLLSRLHFEREREKAEREWAHEDRRLDRESRREFILEAAKHGHLDTVHVRMDKLVSDFLGHQATPRRQLEPFTDDEKARVEDAH